MPRKFLGNDLLGILRGECHRDLRQPLPLHPRIIKDLALWLLRKSMSLMRTRDQKKKKTETIRICGREICPKPTDGRSPHPEACGTILNKLQASLRAHRARHHDNARIRSLRRAAKSRLASKPVVQPSGKNPACTWNPPLDTTGHSWGGSKGA